MPVNFFDAYHTQSNQQQFGLFDEAHPVKAPAYIKETENTTWQGIVNNPAKIKADFYGLDHAIKIPIPPPNPDDKYIESMCDGLLKYNNDLVFVELKERMSSGWVGKSTDQLINSIRLFAENHDINKFDSIRSNVCNKLYPQTFANSVQSQQKFRNETRKLNFKGGLRMELTIKQAIDI